MGHLTYSTTAILETIALGSRYGFDMMEATGLPSGTVYPALRRLERDGMVRSDWEENAVARRAGRPRRRYYEITAAGKEALSRARERFHLFSKPHPIPES